MGARASRAALVPVLTGAALFALWMALVDTREAPQVYAGLVAAAVGTLGSELVRRQGIAGTRLRGRWLLRLYRPLLSVPRDLARLAAVALAALRPGARPASGRFRALPFEPGGGGPEDRGREALAELAGSLSPNTLVVGLDREQGLLLVHQLVPEEGALEQSRKAIDPLELG
ncbi:MAG TPA: Na+/H+ antiporter subunit E [Solirubrobacterales bacterium]|nr:Na+/H+ antiporter subunit E [Solirubrobacterales bacterium]